MAETEITDNYTVCFVNSEEVPKYKSLPYFKYEIIKSFGRTETYKFLQLFELTYHRIVDGEHICDDKLLSWREIQVKPECKKAFIAACDVNSGCEQFKQY